MDGRDTPAANDEEDEARFRDTEPEVSEEEEGPRRHRRRKSGKRKVSSVSSIPWSLLAHC